MIECSPDRPWGLHPAVRSDEDCPRCGWTAPGPLGDARDVIQAAAALGWTVHDGGAALAA